MIDSAEPDETRELLEAMKQMSGTEFVQAMADGRIPQAPMHALFNIREGVIEPGHVRFASRPEARFYNPIGSVHAGFAATVLDSCMGCAVHTTLPRGQGYTTLEFKINLVRPIVAGTGPMWGEGRVLHAGRRVASAEGRLTDEAGRLYAHATTTCLVFPL